MKYLLLLVVAAGALVACPVPPMSPEADAYTTAIIACAATAGYPGAYDYDSDMRCRNGVNCQFKLPSCIGGQDAGR